MELTDEMKGAFRLIEETTECLFITGKAGSGKTTFLKYIVEHSRKNIMVAAPTGIAAINAGGVTLHSLFGIPLKVFSPNGRIEEKLYKDKFQLFAKLDTLIIDEVSMLRPDVLDYINNKLKLYRHSPELFGGVQLILFGDLFQLPPVIRKSEREALSLWYKGHYFYNSHALRGLGFRMIELTKVFRQKDERFVNMLNRIREYALLPMDMEDLCALRDNRASRNFDSKSIHVCSLKRDADKINQQMIGEATHSFEAMFEDKFNPKSAPCDLELQLRVGARVMTLVNDNRQGFYNGSMGTVTKIEPDNVWVKLDAGHEVVLERYTWTDKEYKVENDKIVTIEKGKCTQFPLRLGWAITIHKSQGLTFDNIVIHCPYTFAPGMIYVALSRCTSMEGIMTDFFISPKSIIQDNELVAFTKAMAASDNYFNESTYRSFTRHLIFENEATKLTEV